MCARPADADAETARGEEERGICAGEGGEGDRREQRAKEAGIRGTYLDQREVGDHGLDLADDLGLRGGVEGLELHVEDGLLLRLLLHVARVAHVHS